MRLLAARNANELAYADLARDSGIPVRTLPAYVHLLEVLQLIRIIPAWSSNLLKRVAQRPKVVVLDQGLATYLTNISPEALRIDRLPQQAGGLTEAFVINEVMKQCTWSKERPKLHHFRTLDGEEVDLVLETRDGRVAAIEVKAAATLRTGANKGLARLRDQLGDRFVGGVVFYTGTDALPFGERISALPLSALWS